MALRGASVGTLDSRRVGRAVAALCMVGLVVTAVVLAVAGADKNAQITRLRDHGVSVQVTVTGCLGLLGGSGSNPAGYECRGAYRAEGRRYVEDIPGTGLRRPGSTLRAVIDPDDPALLSTPAILATEHASWRVYVVPGALLLVVIAGGAVALWRARRATAPRATARPAP